MSQPTLATAIELAQSGRIAEAIADLQKLLRRQPANALVNANLGMLLLRSGRAAEALRHLDRSVATDPSRAAVHIDKALALKELGQLEQAADAAGAGARLESANPDVQFLHARLLRAALRYPEASNAALAALRLRPGWPEAADAAAVSLLGSGLGDRAVEVLNDALSHDSNHWNLNVILGVAMLYAPAVDPRQCAAQQIKVGRLFASAAPPPPPPPLLDLHPERPLRVGYLAQDLGARSAISFFIEPALAHHHPEQVQVIVYVTNRNVTPVSPRMRKHVEYWVDAADMPDDVLAAKIRQDRIDILVDLSGRTTGNRLSTLYLRPAPVIVSAIGDAVTTGFDCVQYWIVDATTVPPGDEHLWIEKPVRLPGCFLCYSPAEDSPPSRPPRAPDSTKPITFASFNNAYKVGPEVLKLWARVLLAVPRSRLLLKASGFQHPRARQEFARRLAELGITPDRLEFAGHTIDFPAHLSSYHRVDIALDPFPYNGTTTSCESLWMGVPLVTLAGKAHAGRVGASLLSCVGLPELIASDEDQYVSIAASLAADGPRLSELHAQLRARMSASLLCDGAAHTRALEAAYRQMWRDRCSTSLPSS